MSDTTTDSTNVKSIRHQKILDEAADNPDASFTDIADEIPSATADLVERVLEKYGDPADSMGDTDTHIPEQSTDDTPSDEATDTDDQPEEDMDADPAEPDPSEDSEPRPDVDALSPKELETLHAIHEQPEATQREIADLLDVSGATVSNRVNSIPGFDWSTRAAFTNDLLEDVDEDTTIDPPTTSSATAMTDGATSTGDDAPTPDAETASETSETKGATVRSQMDATTVEQLSDRLTTIEEQLEALERDTTADAESAFSDPELTHKVVHACLEADTISEDEELQILDNLLT